MLLTKQNLENTVIIRVKKKIKYSETPKQLEFNQVCEGSLSIQGHRQANVSAENCLDKKQIDLLNELNIRVEELWYAINTPEA